MKLFYLGPFTSVDAGYGQNALRKDLGGGPVEVEPERAEEFLKSPKSWEKASKADIDKYEAAKKAAEKEAAEKAAKEAEASKEK